MSNKDPHTRKKPTNKGRTTHAPQEVIWILIKTNKIRGTTDFFGAQQKKIRKKKRLTHDQIMCLLARPRQLHPWSQELQAMTYGSNGVFKLHFCTVCKNIYPR